MPGFLDKIKSGAEKAAFEADRLRRSTQAQSGLRALQRDLEDQVEAMGREALSLYDAGTLTQPELLAICPRIDALREQIAAQEAEIERISQERPPAGPGEEPDQPAEARAPVREEPEEPPAAAPDARTCPACNSPLPPGVKFCTECGAKVE